MARKKLADMTPEELAAHREAVEARRIAREKEKSSNNTSLVFVPTESAVKELLQSHSPEELAMAILNRTPRINATEIRDVSLQGNEIRIHTLRGSILSIIMDNTAEEQVDAANNIIEAFRELIGVARPQREKVDLTLL